MNANVTENEERDESQHTDHKPVEAILRRYALNPLVTTKVGPLTWASKVQAESDTSFVAREASQLSAV